MLEGMPATASRAARSLCPMRVTTASRASPAPAQARPLPRSLSISTIVTEGDLAERKRRRSTSGLRDHGVTGQVFSPGTKGVPA